MKRTGEAGHHVERQPVGAREARGRLADVEVEWGQQLLPAQLLALALGVEEGHELGRRASAGGADLALKRGQQAHHASEARAGRRAHEHPPEVAGLHVGGAGELGERHASRRDPLANRLQ